MTVPIKALERRIGALTPEQLREVAEAIRFALDLPQFARADD
jgi:mRNA-degrading endonuclease toxin of MazEF toxin-antitoxin module